MLIYYLIGFLGLDLLIFFHEFGHYFAARACGIRVQSLSFGIGPVLYKFTKGETEFRICAIPFGGATTMAGNDDLKRAYKEKHKVIEQCEDGSIFAVTPIRRILTYLAGPAANILFAYICFVILLVIPVLDVKMTSQVKPVSEQSAAYESGIRDGYTITTINGIKVSTWNEVQSMLSSNGGNMVMLGTDHGAYSVVPKDGLYGLLPYGTYSEKKTPGKSLFESFGPALKETWNQSKTFMDAITGLFLGKNKLSETLGGTFSTSENMGMITEHGFSVSFGTGIRVVLFLLASVSISLGLANLLPITALDGGLILISFAEMIAGHSLRPRTYIVLQVTGLVIVLVLIPVLRIFL